MSKNKYYIYNNFILYQKCFSSEKNNSIYPYFVTFELFRVKFGGLYLFERFVGMLFR